MSRIAVAVFVVVVSSERSHELGVSSCGFRVSFLLLLPRSFLFSLVPRLLLYALRELLSFRFRDFIGCTQLIVLPIISVR
jgi:hypothetical protein